MGKIIQLDENLSNKIAAGEVVERPASVVKELVENAIDAQSTKIEIDVEEAGLKKIRVIDNGSGMEKDDVRLAFERHATSKIKEELDLFRIRTLGFRGEALPSIASVSRVKVVTCTGEGAGTKLVIEGGQEKTFEPGPGRKGTDITVSDLFYNTPARLKYMKTINTELGKITDVVNRLALAHPEVAITLIHNGRLLLKTTGNGDPRQVLAKIYGLNVMRKMIPVNNTSLDFEISGYIALPEVTRASKNYISVMVNGRFIKNYAITNAIIAGYHTLLPINRYPIAFIHIKMDPVLVDVNVHPAKLEVRLSKEKELTELITETIIKAFKDKTLIPDAVSSKKGVRKSEQIALYLDHLDLRKTNKSKIAEADINTGHSIPSLKTENISTSFQETPDKEAYIKEEKTVVENPEHPGQNSLEKAESVDVLKPVYDGTSERWQKGKESGEAGYENQESRMPPLFPVGQVHGTYIIAENENGLYIIDQHAAQERIKYEYYKEQIAKTSNELQELLIPITLELSNEEYIKIEESLDELHKIGLFPEPFGRNSFIIRSHPQWFPKGEEEEMIRKIIDQVLTMRKTDLKKLLEETAIMMSCKGSIKANHRLRMDEMQELIDTLRKTDDPFTCPHGRPVIIHFSTYELKKMFKRVM